MTWALAKVCKVFAIAYSLRNSLKILKGISSGKKCITESGYGVLMFWAIFGFFILWEQYLEYFVRWIPTYYYVKSFFIVLMALPKLKFTNFVFQNLVVKVIEKMHSSIDEISYFSLGDFVLQIPFGVLLLLFPVHHQSESSTKTNIESLDGQVTPFKKESVGSSQSCSSSPDDAVASETCGMMDGGDIQRSQDPPRSNLKAANTPLKVPRTPPGKVSTSPSFTRDAGRSADLYRRGSSIVLDGVRGVGENIFCRELPHLFLLSCCCMYAAANW